MEPATHKLTLTNGAAHVAWACLMHGLTDPADIWTGGQLRGKLKVAKKTPQPLEAEKLKLPDGSEGLTSAYQERVEAWMEEPFSEISVDEDEREVLKLAVQNLSKKEQLPKNQFIDATTELIGLLGLNKRR